MSRLSNSCKKTAGTIQVRKEPLRKRSFDMALDGTDVTETVRKAENWLIEHSF